MSEWKWCENCTDEHHYRMHGTTDDERWHNGPCTMCDCPNFYHNPEDF